MKIVVRDTASGEGLTNMPTIHDVARKAGVSVRTVSRVMNKPEMVSPDTTQSVLKAIEKLGYQPSQVARSLVRKKTNSIGVVMPDIKNTFFNSWYRSVEKCAAAFGYTTLLCSTDEDSVNEMRFVKLFQAHRVDGILMVPRSFETVKYLLKSETVTVLVDRWYDGVKIDLVTTDHYDGALNLTKYLIGQGHRKIGVLTGQDDLSSSRERYRGFCDALGMNGLKVATEFVANCDFKEANALEWVSRMLERKDRPTALFSFNSLMTVGAIKAINARGLKIPDDISLVCYDEIPGNDVFNPKITHVLQPIEELGSEATRILVEKIENPKLKDTVTVLLKPELVLGNSCKTITAS